MRTLSLTLLLALLALPVMTFAEDGDECPEGTYKNPETGTCEPYEYQNQK